MACAYIGLDKPEQAKPFVEMLVKDNPKQASYFTLQADLARLENDWQKAFRLYSRAISLDKNFTQAHLNISPLLMHSGQTEKAIEHLKKVIELDPKISLAHQHLADCYLATDSPDDAMNAYADAFEISPNDAQLCTKIANSWLEVNDLGEAETWFARALELEPENLLAKIGVANVLREGQEETAALDILLPLEEEGKDNIEFLMALGEAHWDEGNSKEALECFEKVKEKEPQRLAIYSRIGRVLSSSGNVDAAIEEYNKALTINKNAIPALTGLAVTLKGKLQEDYAKTMEGMLKRPKIVGSQQASLHNGLAFYYEGQKDFKKAAEHAVSANQFQWESKSKAAWDYSIESHHKHIKTLKETYTKEYFSVVKGLGNASESPVFIVSMPRSGTTLTEQILARHPSALGVGERNYASRGFSAFRQHAKIQHMNEANILAKLNAENTEAFAQMHLSHLEQMVKKSGKENVLRVVDKMPDNYHQLGWIKTIFPNSKIIHIKRDPRDVALSCWFTQFGAIQWACKTDHLVDRIQSYQDLMSHWNSVLGDDILEIEYETLVEDQEGVSRKILEWTGLDWDESCLSFYDSDSLVRTASITQVREPIYNRSVKKWEKYLPYLPELLEALKPV